MIDGLKCCVIIVAAGIGKRMNAAVAKQYIEIKGKPILAHTIERFEECSMVDEIVIVVGKDEISFCEDSIVRKYNYSKVSYVVEGGTERQHSVYNGLKAMSSCDIVLVHDGVRPFVREEELENIIKNTFEHGACVLGVKVKDTIKICDDDGGILSTPKRECLWLAQTPQAFKYSLILQAYEDAMKDSYLGTDDAMLVERTGHKVKMIEGSYENIKITTPEDLRVDFL